MFKSGEILSAVELQLVIKGCLKNDRGAQAKLYNTYAKKMMNLCCWYSRSREEAEEVLHDGFMRVFNYLNSYSGEGSLEGWIRKIMINAALSKFRNKKAGMYPVAEYNTLTHDSLVEPAFANKYDEKILLKMVQGLPSGYRIVFNLHVFEGLNHGEIAELLHISKGTSKSNLSDARKILQSALTTMKLKEVI